MALNKDTLLRAQRSYILIHDDPKATRPALAGLDPKNPTGGWYCLGYTTKDQVIKIAHSGGDTELVDTAEDDGVEAIITPKTRTIDFDALQFEVNTLDLAYNGSYNSQTGEYAVPTNSNPLSKAVFVVIKTVKGKTVSIGGFGTISTGDEPSLAFKELSKLPLKVALLTDDKGNNMYWGGDIVAASAGSVAPGGTGSGTGSVSFTAATAHADIDAAVGDVIDVVVDTPGSGYSYNPTVNLVGGGGTGATAHSTLDANGGVASVTVTAGGTGYTSAPTVEFVYP